MLRKTSPSPFCVFWDNSLCLWALCLVLPWQSIEQWEVRAVRLFVMLTRMSSLIDLPARNGRAQLLDYKCSWLRFLLSSVSFGTLLVLKGLIASTSSCRWSIHQRKALTRHGECRHQSSGAHPRGSQQRLPWYVQERMLSIGVDRKPSLLVVGASVDFFDTHKDAVDKSQQKAFFTFGRSCSTEQICSSVERHG